MHLNDIQKLINAMNFITTYDKYMTTSKLVVLIQVYRALPESKTMVDLFKESGLGVNYNAYAKNINRLCVEEDNLIRKSQSFLKIAENPENKQSKLVTLTNFGRETLEKFMEKMQ